MNIPVWVFWLLVIPAGIVYVIIALAIVALLFLLVFGVIGTISDALEERRKRK